MSKPSGWQLSGNAPEAYERYYVPAWMGEWAQDLVTAAHVQVGERVLDVGCGTGVVARRTAQAVGTTGKVVGLDVNESMLSMAQQLAPALEWRQSDAASMPFADAEFDVVLCQQGLQYFPDRTAALCEMARVLAPGGRLALSVWLSLERRPFFLALVAAVESHLRTEEAASFRGSMGFIEAEALRSLVTAAGFRDVHLRLEIKMGRHPSPEEFVLGALAASPLAGAVSAMPDTARTAMVHDVIQSLRAQSYIDDGGLAVPMEGHVVTARV